MEMERILSASGPTGATWCALRPQGTQEDRLVPVRGLPRPEPLRQQLLLLGVLHVRHQGGRHRQGARRRRWTAPSFSWTCAPTARTSSATTTGPKKKRGALHPQPGAHHRSGAGHRRPRALCDRAANIRGDLRHGGALRRSSNPPRSGGLAENWASTDRATSARPTPSPRWPLPGPAFLSAAPSRGPRTFPASVVEASARRPRPARSWPRPGNT
jgi:hypothetical protein